MSDDLPPSAKFVRSKLADTDGELTRAEIQELTGLPKSTVAYALRVLREQGIVQTSPDMSDPSKPTYSVPCNNCTTAEVEG